MYIDEHGVLKKVSLVDLREGVLTIPQGTLKIGYRAICQLKDLRTIVFPPSLKEIDINGIFETGIVHLTIPKTIQKLGSCAFEGNEYLSILEIDNPKTKFSGDILYRCRSIVTCRVGMQRHNVRCLKYGKCFEILSKKEVDVYTVYYVQPFYDSVAMGKMFVACKQNVYGDGVSIARAIEDCHSRYMTPNIIKKYQDITLDTLIGWHDYRSITGACDEGVLKWIREHGYQDDDKLTVRELLAKLGDAFGHKEFEQFVADRYKDRAERRNKK